MPPAKQVLTVTLNPALDQVYWVDQLRPGALHDLELSGEWAGGKGNNVARVLTGLGHSAVATGLLGGGTGERIRAGLEAEGIATRFLPVAGESRICTTLLDRAGGPETVLRAPAPLLSEADLERFVEQFTGLLRGAEFVVLSGSLPPGVPTDFYGRLVSLAYRTAQVRCLVDAKGEALQGVLRAQPYMVKPNLAELTEWAGRSLNTEDEVLQAAQELMEAGPLTVAVSMGPGGLLLVSPEGAWRAEPPPIQPVNTQGSGDALVAGLLAGLLEERSAAEILRMAVAAGSANALTPGVAEVDPFMVAQLLRRVRVRRLG